MTATIEAHGLEKRYRKTRALDGLELVAEAGQVTAVLGPNGAGKTTFVRAVATLLRPDSGTLHVFGHDVRREPDRVRRLLGLAGQFAAVEPAMSGRENLEMVARLYGQGRRTARASAQRVLEQLDLVEPADRLVRTYSGGMRRCCSWTSRRPASTRAAGSSSGTRSGRSSRRAPTCCSPRSTWTRPTSLPDGS
jgi:ABC-2 type transport system ATP-binding protein